MVRRFYADVAQDDLLGPMFNDVAKVSWADHLPKLTDFWCRALLGHVKRAFTRAQFERWLSLFHETLELGWSGLLADRAGELADNLARVHSQRLIGESVTASTR